MEYIGGLADIPRIAIYTSSKIEDWYIEELGRKDILGML